MSLHNALGNLREVRQFFIWRLTWEDKSQKYRKTPCSLDGGSRPIDASLSKNWTSYETANAALAKLVAPPGVKFTLGLWMTPDLGIFFLDIDNCADGKGTVTPLADVMLGKFRGALVEWSSSLRGIHIIGRGVPPHHRSRDIGSLGMELYHEKRGIAFGLHGQANGCADTNHESALSNVVASHFPREVAADVGTVRGDWRGPADDDELIRRALKSKQRAASAFGAKPSFKELWEGTARKNSENDAALASHLAFWTGCDEDRIVRLMHRSGMKREKWLKHNTYVRELTVRSAIAHCKSVYCDSSHLPVANRSSGPTVRNAADLLKTDFKEVQWAIRGLVPEGVTIISGDPKIGKSWLVYQACIAVATGTSLWHGRPPEVQGDALMLALEDNDRRLKRRLDKLLIGLPGTIPNLLHYSTDWPRAEDGVKEIASWLRAHPNCRLVVIDTISAFRDNDPGRKSAYAHDYVVGEMLKPLAREFSCAIVLVMHNRKQAAGDVMHKVSGTQGMTGSVDNIIILERARGDMDAKLTVDGRDIEEMKELALRLNDGRWQFVGNVDDVQRSKERNSVIEALVSLKGKGTARSIFDELGGQPKLSTVRVRLSRMVKSGELELRDGTYSVTRTTAFVPTALPVPTDPVR